MRIIISALAIVIITFFGCTKPDNGTKTTVPAAPTTLTGKVLSSIVVNLSWSDNSTNETGFKIERKTGIETYKEITSTDINIETYNDTGLISNTTYNYRVYAFNSAGSSITYSNEVTITTDSLKKAPTVITTPVSLITSDSALSGGTISSDGGAPIISRGVVWSTNQNPTISLFTKTSDSTGIGTFVSKITGLANNTTYYVKAYATNSIGTSYGDEVSFKTLDYRLPTLSDYSSSDTFAIGNVTSNSAAAWIGSLISDGGTAIIARGVVWSTSPNPTISLTTKISMGTGTGGLHANITGLNSKVKYFAREYATNIVGTVYSREINFITEPNQQNAAVGDYFGGGIVFYILKSGDIGFDASTRHGLIAGELAHYQDSYSQPYKYFYSWGDTSSTKATATAIGSGKSNTDKIIALTGTGYRYAAIAATKDIYGNGYQDWYLPSKSELNQMYLNIGRGTSGAYWSSSEVDNFSAYCQDFANGNQVVKDKFYGAYVRAIRSF